MINLGQGQKGLHSAEKSLPRLPKGYLPGTRMSFTLSPRQQRKDTLVVIFLRGAADGLNMVIPHAEDNYHHLRPSLRVPRPDEVQASRLERSIDLDGFFGFHPAMRPLLPAWQEGNLACVHACGGPDQSRSHFKAMELMERGVSEESGPATGWLGRQLAASDHGNPSPLRALALAEHTPRSLYGPVPAAALQSIADFHLGDSAAAGVMAETLSALYHQNVSLGGQGQKTLEILETLQKLDPQIYQSSGTPYPETEFGHRLRQVAMLIKADVGLETAALDLGGWDTHFAQGVQQGIMPRLLGELSEGLAAIHSDLSQEMSQLTLVVMTEFGRRAYENASLGTDHGHGGLMLLLGGSIAGGQVIARWPGLDNENLVGPGDLAVTIDYRDVLVEILSHRLETPALAEIFPDYNPKAAGVIHSTASQDS